MLPGWFDRVLPAGARAWWERTAPFHGIVFFLAGFAWDSMTLRRVDRMQDNLLLLGYLALLGVLLVAERRIVDQAWRWRWLFERIGWVRYAAQFLFGSLYSAYVVFYFKSATPGRTLLFVLLLVGLMVANEFMSHWLRAERLRLGLYLLCAFSFLLFFVPVVTGYVGVGLFTACAVVAVAITALVAFAMYWRPGEDPRARLYPTFRANGLVWAGILGVLYTLDFLAIIPPVPLALMDAGIYRDVRRTPDGYALAYEKPPLWAPLRHREHTYLWRPGDKVYCFSAVFAPTGMALAIEHRWEWWDADRGEWVHVNTVPFEVVGGREGGYRGYTLKKNVKAGDWRVAVRTPEGRELGRVGFSLAIAPEGTPPAETKVRVYE